MSSPLSVKNVSRIIRSFRFCAGSLLSLNFCLFWALPILIQGILWKYMLKQIMMPLYEVFDQNLTLRKFAINYIYSQERSADYFAITLITLVTTLTSISMVFYVQINTGSLPLWLLAIYYFAWVGFGGRIMGASYALAHKEGHNHNLYKPWVRRIIGGHIFENVVGPWFGNIPWNFTTSHIFIHHRLDGGLGDTFYLWDLDRSSMYDFTLYLWRVLLHTSGYSSVIYFQKAGNISKGNQLLQGIFLYWALALFIFLVTRSITFVFLVYIQPFLCMTFFLGIINIGFHGFLEFDENGEHIPEVNATTIIEGDDDYFGEDDHMAHHYNTTVFYKDLPALQASKVDIFKQRKASVFRQLSIFELSILIVLGQWEKLAEHYVDYSGTMTKSEIILMLRRRAKLKESCYDLDKCTDSSLGSVSRDFVMKRSD